MLLGWWQRQTMKTMSLDFCLWRRVHIWSKGRQNHVSLFTKLRCHLAAYGQGLRLKNTQTSPSQECTVCLPNNVYIFYHIYWYISNRPNLVSRKFYGGCCRCIGWGLWWVHWKTYCVNVMLWLLEIHHSLNLRDHHLMWNLVDTFWDESWKQWQ